MADGLVLLLHRRLALVIFVSAAAVVQQKFGQADIAVAMSLSFHVIDKTAKTHERLFHLLVPVEPGLLSRADIGYPAVR